jgi:hypothetical protein
MKLCYSHLITKSLIIKIKYYTIFWIIRTNTQLHKNWTPWNKSQGSLILQNNELRSEFDKCELLSAGFHLDVDCIKLCNTMHSQISTREPSKFIK